MRIDSEEVIILRIWDNHGKEVGYEQKGVLVRCKDCKWRNKAGCALEIVDDSDKPSDNDYCSYGERKEK